MGNLEKILESNSIGEASIKIYGYSNGKSSNKIKLILSQHGYSDKIFDDKKYSRLKKYEKISKNCPICHKEFITLKGHKKEKTTCSIACSNSLIPKREKNYGKRERKSGKPRTKKIINKKCERCNILYHGTPKSKYCSDFCRNEIIRKKIKERIEKGEHTGWQTRNIESYPEKFFKKVLDNLNIRYDFNLPVTKKSLGIKESSCYFLDFYIEIGNRKIDLEIDGKQHDYKERKEKDQIRDSILSKNNYEIYRIKWKNPINENNKNYIKTEIEKLKEYLGI